MCEDLYCMQNVNGLHKIWSSVCVWNAINLLANRSNNFQLYMYMCVCVWVYPARLWAELNNASFLRLNFVWIIWFLFWFVVFFFSLFCFSAFSLINCLPPSSLPGREKRNQFGSKTQLISRILHLSISLSVTLFLYLSLFFVRFLP